MSVPVTIEIQTTAIFIGDGFVDVSAQAFSFTVRRGRNDYTQPFQTGVASVSFRNQNGHFDPDNTASPFADVLFLGQPLRIVANKNEANEEIVFTGNITDIVVNHDVIGESTVTITASDRLAIVAQQQFDAGVTFPEQNTTDRVIAVLLEADTLRTSDEIENLEDNSNGQSICAAGPAVGNVLQYLHEVAVTEQGEIFALKNGWLFLTNRYASLADPVLTFTDTTGGSNYEAIERLLGASELYNQLAANRPGEPPVIRTFTPPFDPFGPIQRTRFLDLREVFLRTDAEVADLLDFALVRFSDPTTRISSLTTLLDDKTVAEQDSLLGLELVDSVQVNYTPSGVSQLSLPGTIQAIAHDYTVGQGWRMTFSFIPRDTSAYLVLDDATLGRLDENALAF